MFFLCALEPQNMKNKTPNSHYEDNMSPIALAKHKKKLEPYSPRIKFQQQILNQKQISCNKCLTFVMCYKIGA
jgi:hypothetical protein